jgi:DNA-binding CsgD family transcriptional regulator
MRDGRFVDAEGHIEFALSSWPRGGIATGLLFALRREQERVHEVIDALDWVVEQLPGALMWESLRVLARLEVGRVDEARSLFNAIPQWDVPTVTSHWTLRLCALYAEFCDAFGETDLAAIVYERLHPYAHHHVFASNSDYACGSASHYLGILATTLGRWDAAERHFADALDASERWGYPLHAAYSRYAWGELLARRGGTADRERIAALLSDARAIANSVGSVRLGGLVERFGKQHGIRLSSAQSEAVNPAELALSPREREVLAHIVAGRTDKEIAEVLYISPRTVTTHVTNILNKLGVSSRVEAAVLVTQNGRGSR